MEPKLVRKDIQYQKKTLLIVSVLVACLFIGGSFSLLSSSDETEEVVSFKTGNFNLEVKTTGTLSLDGEVPKSYDDGFKSNDITLTLTNTGSLEIGKYEVKLEGDSSTTLEANYIRYSVSEDDGKTYLESKLLSETNNIIYTGYNLKDTKVLKVKLWIDEEAGEAALKKSYNGKINVELYQNEDTAVQVVKSKLVSNYSGSEETFEGGLVGVNTDGNLYHETNSEEIREYRYSGPTVNNYVTFNDELWRIIGVFFDENGFASVKIVRKDELSEIFPDTYTINGITYNINVGKDDAVYWNKKVEGINNNDWTTAGIQYFLNSESDETNSNNGYMSYLSQDAKNMIKTSIYYLGNVNNVWNTDSDTGINDTAPEAYINERGSNTNCTTYCPGGYLWPGNQATWTGKIGLLYPSDFGYSYNSKYWNIKMKKPEFRIHEHSWLSKLKINSFEGDFLISPTSENATRVASLHSEEFLNYVYVTSTEIIRPCLYLKTNVKITSGTGEESNPYTLFLD